MQAIYGSLRRQEDVPRALFDEASACWTTWSNVRMDSYRLKLDIQCRSHRVRHTLVENVCHELSFLQVFGVPTLSRTFVLARTTEVRSSKDSVTRVRTNLRKVEGQRFSTGMWLELAMAHLCIEPFDASITSVRHY